MIFARGSPGLNENGRCTVVRAKPLDTETELASGCQWLVTASSPSLVKSHLIAQPGKAAQQLTEGLSPTF